MTRHSRNRRTLHTGYGLIISLVWLLSACKPAEVSNYPMLTSGQKLYDWHCAACHRDRGRGNFLKGVPSAVNYAQLDLQSFTDIIQGHQRPLDTKMPLFTHMPRFQVEAIAYYLRAQLTHQ